MSLSVDKDTVGQRIREAKRSAAETTAVDFVDLAAGFDFAPADFADLTAAGFADFAAADFAVAGFTAADFFSAGFFSFIITPYSFYTKRGLPRALPKPTRELKRPKRFEPFEPEAACTAPRQRQAAARLFSNFAI